MVFVLDSSSSISDADYSTYQNTIAASINQGLTENSRLGVMQFATSVQIEFNIDNDLPKSEWVSIVQSKKKIKNK